jgi:hypothetical protein
LPAVISACIRVEHNANGSNITSLYERTHTVQ